MENDPSKSEVLCNICNMPDFTMNSCSSLTWYPWWSITLCLLLATAYSIYLKLLPPPVRGGHPQHDTPCCGEERPVWNGYTERRQNWVARIDRPSCNFDSALCITFIMKCVAYCYCYCCGVVLHKASLTLRQWLSYCIFPICVLIISDSFTRALCSNQQSHLVANQEKLCDKWLNFAYGTISFIL
jgi:hypothetical protein